MMWSASFKKDPHALAFLYYYSVTGKTVNTWISKECLLCYDQSQQRSSHKTTNQLLAFLLAVQFCHAWLAFFCNTITFQKYYWCSRFSRFDCNNVKLWINQCVCVMGQQVRCLSLLYLCTSRFAGFFIFSLMHSGMKSSTF